MSKTYIQVRAEERDKELASAKDSGEDIRSKIISGYTRENKDEWPDILLS